MLISIRSVFLFALLVSSSLADITVFRYEDEPNEGQHLIQGIQTGSEFLRPFQYIVETANNNDAVGTGIANLEGDVEVTFFNQIGQVLHLTAITHPPFNSTVTPEQQVFSPNLPMFEGRTQLLAWARNANDRPVRFEINNPPGTGTINFPVRNGSFQCVTAGNCTVTFGALGTITSNGPNVTPIGFNLPANTALTVANATDITTITGVTDASPWFFGPHVFQTGTDSGNFIFIDSNQGPPDSPNIDFFTCQGTANCIDAPLLVETPKPNLNPINNRFRYQVVFNKLDLFNATNSSGSGVLMTIQYSGFVENNPALFRNPDGTVGLPGAQPKRESNAFVDSFLLPIRFTTVVSPEQSRKTTITGPYAISVGPGTPGVPQVVYPDEVVAYPYGAPVFPNLTPFPVKYPFGPSLGPGMYTTVNYNFTGMNDGDYEIWISSDDFTAAQTLNGQSPGAVTASAGRVPGVTAIISVIRDTIPPNSFEVSMVPNRRILIVGDQSEPPLPYLTYQGELFDVTGRVQDERGDENIVQVDLRRDDGVLVTTPGKNGHFEQIPTFGGGNFFQRLDFTPVLPDSTLSPPNPHPAIGGQRGYQLVIYPVDPQLNTSETTRALYVIKDLQPPADPVLLNPVDPTVIVTNRLLTVRVSGSNQNTGVPPADLREHGNVNMSMTVIDSSGFASVFTTVGNGLFLDPANQSSLLDDNLTWNIPPSPLGGAGLTGVDFFGNVPSTFEFSRIVNLDGFIDGQMTIIIHLEDEVGNRSVNTTSIVFIKDTTGPVIRFSDAERQFSGPDNQFPFPNRLGADDEAFVVSLISPEFTVDTGPDGVQPLVPDPGTMDQLRLVGQVIDGISFIDRVELTGAHVSSVTSNLAGLNLTDAVFFVDVDMSTIPEAQREILDLRGFDQNGISGPTTSVQIFRDVIPARRPVLSDPPIIPFTGRRQVFTSTDSLRIAGSLAPNDAPVLEVAANQSLRSKVVILTPSTDPGSFVTGQTVPRLPLSSPTTIPRTDSFFSSLPQTAFVASWHEVFVNDEGGFDTRVPIDHLPQSPTIPTTIWVQAVDAFSNTEPQASSEGIEIFYFPGGAPIASLEIVEFRNQLTNIVIFPPLSLPPSLLSTLFTPLESVQFRLRTIIPMVKAPELSLLQFGATTRIASLLTSLPQGSASTVFEYSYSPISQVGRFDGQVQALVSKGVDLFGNAVRSATITTAFYVDSLAPNLATTSPDFLVEEVRPRFIPPQGERVNQQGIEVSVDWDDFVTSNGSLDRSGLNTAASTLEIRGPLHINPENALALLPLTTPVAGFDKTVRILSPLLDGVYRISTVAVDNVGNQHPFYSSFVYDQTPIAQPLLLTNPTDKSVISRFPTTGVSAFVDLIIQRLDANENLSGFSLFDPLGNPVSLSTTSIIAPNHLRRFLTVPPVYDGSIDGLYQIHIFAVDKSGNTTEKIHSFLLDSQAPVFKGFYPPAGTCQRGPISILDVITQDLPGRLDIPVPVSGVARESRLKLFLAEPYLPTNPEAQPGFIGGDSELLSVEEAIPTSLYKLAFLPSGTPTTPKILATDGSLDGKMELQARILDYAGNIREETSHFFYDNQAPSIRIQDFSEGRLFLTTLGINLEVFGSIQDDGPCHFFVGGAQHSQNTTLSVGLRFFDPNNQVALAPVLFPQPVDNLIAKPEASFTYHSAQADFGFTTFIPGIFPAGFYEVELVSEDQAGNSFVMKRVLSLLQANRGIPRILFPPDETVQNGESSPWIQSSALMRVEWEMISGLNQVEIEVRRLLGSASGVVFQKIYPATDLFSELISLTPTSPASGLEPFEVRIRGLNSLANSTPFSPPRTFFLDGRPFFLENASLITGNQIQNLSSKDTTLSTNIFELELSFSKPYLQRPDGSFASGAVILKNMGQTVMLKSMAPGSSTTQKIRFTGEIPINPRQSYPRENLELSISDFSDLLGQKMSGFTTRIMPDFGAEVSLRLFTNPVSNKELVAVVRFVSARGLLEEMPIERQNNLLISPQFQLLKNQAIRPIQALAVDERILEGRVVAHTYTMPLVFQGNEHGFFFLRTRVMDRYGRWIEKENEIRVEAYEPKASLSLVLPQSGYHLDFMVPETQKPGSVWLGGNLSPIQKISGELELLYDARIFGAGSEANGLEARLKISPSVARIGSLTHAGVYEVLGDGQLLYAGDLNASQIRLGRDYVVARDMVDPKLEWTGADAMVSGWFDAPFELSDSGSGPDWQSLSVKLDDVSLDWDRKRQDQISLFVPKAQSSREVSLNISARDRSGRETRLQKSVLMLAGEGLEWVQVAPSPVRKSQDLSIEFFANEPAVRAWFGVYDAASRLVATQEMTPVLGRNRMHWDLRTRSGNEIANGVYFYRLRLETSRKQFVHRGKFAVLR